MGMVEADGATPNPLTAAYGAVREWLTGAVMTACARTPAGVWVVDLSRPAGYRARIEWAEDGTTAPAVLPTGFAVRQIRSLDGRTIDGSALADGPFRVTSSPVLLEARAR
jgi:hypothetical protein